MSAATATDHPAPAARSRSPRRPSPTLAGTGALVRFVLRRDRVRLPVWIVSIAALVLVTATSVQGLYPTEADLVAAAQPYYDNPAIIALNAPTYGIETMGGQIVFQLGSFNYVIVALMAMFLVGRHTRGDEEEGRTELLRATVVGRNAPVTAAVTVVGGAFVVLGALVTLILWSQDLPAAGSVSYGAAVAAFGLCFAAVTAVAAQVTDHNRGVYGITGGVLALAYLLRAVGDVGSGTLSWLSPMGWAQAMRPYAGERWFPLLLLLGATAALGVLTFALLDRRDLGAGLVATRPGPSTARPGLLRPAGLELRMQRGSLIGWSIGLVLAGVAYGSMGQDVADIIGDSEELAEFMTMGAGDLTDRYFASSLMLMALITGGFALSSALRARSDETAGRAESMLAGPLGRGRWLGAHLAVTLAGTVAVIGLGGLGMGATWAVIDGDAGQVVRLTVAALAYVPALWVLAGLAAALFGLAPRALPLVWAVLAGCAVVGLLGELLDLPQWALDLSPFTHVGLVPADDLSPVPAVVLTVVAGALLAAGLAGFRRRDAGY